MYHYFERSDQRYENLLEEAAGTQKTYQQQLQADLTVEKTNRLKKLKLTNQLQMWLHKYDKDAGERTHELKELVAKLNTRQQEYNRWKRNIFDPQEKKYGTAESLEEMCVCLNCLSLAGTLMQWRRSVRLRYASRRNGSKRL